MTKFFNIEEMLSSAKNECIYLKNLIKAIRHDVLENLNLKLTLDDEEFLTKNINILQNSYTKINKQINNLWQIFNNAINENSNIITNQHNTIMQVEHDCLELRKHFHILHKNFINILDKDFESHIRNSLSYIKSTLTYTKKCIGKLNDLQANTNNSNQQTNEKIIQLSNAICYLESMCEPLSKHSDELELNAFITSNFENLAEETRYIYIEEHLQAYTHSLESFRDQIIEKLIFQYTPNSITEYLTFIFKLSSTYTPNFFSTIPEQNVAIAIKNESNIDLAVTFIKNNCEFLIAPMQEETNKSFQEWAKENIDLITPLSDILKNTLQTPDQHGAYFQALSHYINHGKDNLLRWFLSNHSAIQLNSYLAKLSMEKETPLFIQNWNDHNNSLKLKG